MIVKVRIRKSDGDFLGNEYSYVTEKPLEPGDIVIVPTRGGISYAKVIKTHVPETEVDPQYRNSLREIIDYAPKPI